MQIIYALSVHRLTTSGLDVQTGLTAEGLKDDLCLYLPLPEQDSDFLLGHREHDIARHHDHGIGPVHHP